MNAESALSVVVLPEPVPPLTRTLQRARTASASRSRSGAGQVPLSTSSSEPKPRGRKRRIVRTDPSSASGGDHDVHPRAVRQARVAERLGLVDAAPERREDALDRVPQLVLAGEAHAGRLDPAAPLDPDRPGSVDHDLVDSGIGEQRLERAEARRALGDAGDEPRAGVLVEQPGLAIDERADALLQLAVRAVTPGLAEQPLAQRARRARRARRRGASRRERSSCPFKGAASRDSPPAPSMRSR